MSTEAPRHTNRLIHASSPYLLQHAHNPVDWCPWGEEALAKARAEDKLTHDFDPRWGGGRRGYGQVALLPPNWLLPRTWESAFLSHRGDP